LNSIPKELTAEYIYSKTGIQFLYFNTLYQLAAELNEGRLKEADKFLMLPDLLNNILCGSDTNEITNASSTQLLNAYSRDWDWELIEKIGLPKTGLSKTSPTWKIIGKN
jgi:rhamnulokinase